MTGKAALTRVMQIPLKLRRARDPDRNNPRNRNDFDVIGPDANIIGRIFRPGGGTQDLDVDAVGRREAAAAQSRLRRHAREGTRYSATSQVNDIGVCFDLRRQTMASGWGKILLQERAIPKVVAERPLRITFQKALWKRVIRTTQLGRMRV